MSPRVKKILGDIEATPWRFAMMLITAALSTAAIVAMLLAYVVLTQAVQKNYLSINPAAAQIMLGNADVFQQAEKISQQREKNSALKDSEVGGHFYEKIEIAPDQFVTALIFVVPDFSTLSINKINLMSGQWPKEGEIILERKALKFAKLTVGDTLTLAASDGAKRLKISGSAHDPALAPADTERMIYAYISHHTFQQLHKNLDENFIKITLAQEPSNHARIQEIATQFAHDIESIAPIHEIRIPPYATHPHQTQMTSGLRLLLIFAGLAVLLASVLIATTFWGLLAQQSQQIGMMKTLGATQKQITFLYFALITFISLLAFAIGLPLGLLAGRAMISMAADLLNLDITNPSLPVSLWILCGLLAVGLPLLFSYFPLKKSINRSVHSALSDYGVAENFSAAQRSNPVTKNIFSFLSPSFRLVLRNLLRRRARFNFMLILLGTAGAVFLSSQNLLASWYGLISAAEAHRHYQIEINFAEEVDKNRLDHQLQNIAGIQTIERWDAYSAAVKNLSDFSITQTYPDGGHGSLSLRTTPGNTELISKELIQGHWLSTLSKQEVVLNQTAHHDFFSQQKIGDSIQLEVNGTAQSFKLVGILREPLTGATAYSLTDELASPRIKGIRIQLRQHDEFSIEKKSAEIEAALKNSGIAITNIVTENHRKKSGLGHVMLMVVILVTLAILIALVAFFGLAAVVSTNVSARLREFAVMRSLGASHTKIYSLITQESLLLALASFFVALPITFIFSFAIVKTIAAISRQPLALHFSTPAFFIWVCILLLGAVAASLVPALKAARKPIKEVLAYQ